MKDYTLYYASVFMEAEAFIHALKSDWTKRQLDLQRASVGGVRLVENAFRLHQEAIQDRDWDAVEFTLEQLHTYTFNVLAAMVDRLQAAARKSTTSRASAKKAKGAKREHGHDWDKICQEYDKLMSKGIDRPRVISNLANKNETSKTVIRRGLLDRGRGAENYKNRSSKKR